MSLADFDERDLDRLADYLAGELPAPTAAEVERLVRTDNVWSRAYAELSAADPHIRALLRADGRSQIDPMPADIVARVDAALADAAREPASGTAARTAAPTTRVTANPASSAKVVALDAQRRRRRRLWLSTAAAAVVGIGLCTGAATVLRNQGDSGAATSAAGGVPQNGSGHDSLAAPGTADSPTPRVPADAPGPTRTYVVTRSGTNYTPDTLRTLMVRSASGESQGVSGGGQPPEAFSTVPNGLDACLVQVMAVHPGTVASVDYAEYESQPAVIIVIQRPTGPIVVAAGSKCGAPGPDELAAVAG